jgi:N-acetylneuraminate epimerase
MRIFALLAVLVGATQNMPAVDRAIQQAGPAVAVLAPLPNEHGFAGMFAGVSGGALLCAGGANFPEKPLAQGGKKIWHDRVFALAGPDGAWREVGRLPRVNGYGVSATWRDAVVLVGGGDSQGNFRDACLMRWDGARLAFEVLPPLPIATANGSGAVVGETLYVAGGQETPTATAALRRCFTLDLASPTRAWREITWPTGAPGRILAVAAPHDGWFYLFSGADLFPNAAGQADRRYLNDAWRYRPGAGWHRLADLPHAIAAAPSPAMNAGRSQLVIAGGVWPEFLATLPKNAPHPGFPRELLAYDVAADTWSAVPPSGFAPSAPPRVTAPLVGWRHHFVVPSGEVAPGIRTPSVLTYQFAP